MCIPNLDAKVREKCGSRSSVRKKVRLHFCVGFQEKLEGKLPIVRLRHFLRVGLPTNFLLFYVISAN